MKRSFCLFVICLALALPALAAGGDSKEIFLFHLKTSLSRDDAQICVAYNVIWAALAKGYDARVLVDADAVNTFKTGWRGKDDIEGFKLPDNLRVELSEQFNVLKKEVPGTYGEFLQMLKAKGAKFYINRGMLIVSGIGTPEDPLEKISAKFFIPVTLDDMVKLRAEAGHYMVY